MVRYGNGYLMVGSDGGIFTFSDLGFVGSLGATPPVAPDHERRRRLSSLPSTVLGSPP